MECPTKSPPPPRALRRKIRARRPRASRVAVNRPQIEGPNGRRARANRPEPALERHDRVSIGRRNRQPRYVQFPPPSWVTHASVFRTLGVARLTLHDPAGAGDALLSSLEINPHTDACANLGVAYVRLRRYDAAIAACQAAIALDPLHAEAATVLGDAYANQANQAAFPLASATFERAAGLRCETAP